jgi:hypothetical protein
MLLGLFSSGKMNNKIENSNKYNAVTPVKGLDFKQLINVMRLEALPFQSIIFPIQKTYCSIAMKN